MSGPLNEEEEFEFLYQMEREAKAGIPPPNPAPVPTTAMDRAVGSWGGRMLQGAASPILAGVQLLGGEKGREMVAELDAMKKRGMAAEGKEGFDWYGLMGSMLPGAGIAKGVTAALPAATSALGRIGTGATVGATTAAAQPIADSPDFWTDKAKQVGAGGVVGGAVPAVAEALRAARGAPQLNPVKAATLAEGQAAGYVVPPSSVNPSFLNNRLESIAGKAAVGQEAAKRNQDVTNALVRRELGLPDNAPLTEKTLESVRKDAGKIYDQVSKLVPGGELQGLKVKTVEARKMVEGPATGLKTKITTGEAPNVFGLSAREIRDESGNLLGMQVGSSSKGAAPIESIKTSVTSRGESIPGPLEGLKVRVKEVRGGAPVEQLKQARADASAKFSQYAVSKDPDHLKQAHSFWAQAEALDDSISASLKAKGREDLVEALAQARTKIAKAHDVERALNLGDENVSAPILGRQLDKFGLSAKSGELATIGKMAEAFPSVMREGARVPTAGVSGTDAAASAILGTMGYGAGGPAGILAAGLPLLRGPARNLVLSPGYQRFATEGLSPQRQAMIDALMRQGAGMAGAGTGRAF